MPVLEQMPDKVFHSDFYRTRNNKMICKFIKLNQTKCTIPYSVIMSLLSLGCKMFPHGMCSPVCVICMYVCLYTCWHRGWPWVSPSLPVQLIFWGKVFWLNLELSDWLHGIQWSPYFCSSSPRTGVTNSSYSIGSYIWVLGIGTRSSRLRGRSFTYWAITIDPLHCLMSDYFLPLLDIIN